MPNMSYCRFQNTKGDLRDCVDNFWNIHSKDEAIARKRLVALAKEIVELAEQDEDAVENCHYEDEDAEDGGEDN